MEQPTSNRGYDIGFVFPPEGMTCHGGDNSTVVIRFPDGAGERARAAWNRFDHI